VELWELYRHHDDRTMDTFLSEAGGTLLVECGNFMPAVGRARGYRRSVGKPRDHRPLRTGRPRNGARVLSDGKPLTHEHVDAAGRRYTVKGGKIHYTDLAKDRRIVSEHKRTSRRIPRWRGDLPGTSRI